MDRILDVGFGAGESTVALAREHPGARVTAVERRVGHVTRLQRRLDRLDAADAGRVEVVTGGIEDVLGELPPAAYDRIQVLFPDPWPKRRHAHRRTLHDRELLTNLTGLLAPDGVLLVVTDVEPYAAAVAERMAEVVAADPALAGTPPPPWPRTRFAARAVRDGRAIHAAAWTRTPVPAQAS